MTEKKQKPLAIAGMTDGQLRCYDLLCACYNGAHHVPNIYACGNGIRVAHHGDMATFDGDMLTRLVVLAHDMAVRVEVVPSGPMRVGILLHPRQREGRMHERHPDLATALGALSSLRAAAG
jgi:hypothetical protein